MTKPEQIPLCTPDEIRPVASARLPDLDCWLVVAFWISGGDGDGWWKVFTEHWLWRGLSLRAAPSAAS